MVKGTAILGILLFIAFLLLAVFGLDYAFIAYYDRCGDIPLQECLTEQPKKSEELKSGEESVTATGDFTYQDYSIHISMDIPLGGGAVTGQVTGTCSATISGTSEAGGLSGKAFGSCSPFGVPLPAKATFTGTVDKTSKTVLITGKGSAVGISKEGSITLIYR